MPALDSHNGCLDKPPHLALLGSNLLMLHELTLQLLALINSEQTRQSYLNFVTLDFWFMILYMTLDFGYLGPSID